MSMKQEFDKDYFRTFERVGLSGHAYAAKPYWYSFWERFISSFTDRGSKILECGCGLGFLLKRLQLRYTCVGVDISYYALEIAQKNTGNGKLVQASAVALPFASTTFRLVVAFDLIEHLAAPEVFLQEARRVLRDGGGLIIATPNPRSFGARLKKRNTPSGTNADRQVSMWFGWTDLTHINVRTPLEWREALMQQGFSIARDGSTGLHDIPYFWWMPLLLQKAIFTVSYVTLTRAFGFFPWLLGENYVCYARKQ